MMLLVILFVVPVMILIGAVCYCALEIVKVYRCSKWCKAHNGILIGSDEWAEWCYDNGVKPSYFI